MAIFEVEYLKYLAVFVDFERAFDMVWRKGLLIKLKESLLLLHGQSYYSTVIGNHFRMTLGDLKLAFKVPVDQ